jgi:predicted anti-sigma-YlaC factor YlaD
MGMLCETAREAISAALDGEPAPVPDDDLRDHLASCRQCREWQAAAVALTRRARMRPAPAVDDLAPAIVAAAEADGLVGRTAAGRRDTWRRLGLVLVALGQLALAVPVLVLGHDHAAPMHVAHELGSLDVALAVGMLAAVRRPQLATGMLPLVGVAATLLLATAIGDLATAATGPLDELPHLLDAIGFGLLWSLALDHRSRPAPELRRAPRRSAA